VHAPSSGASLDRRAVTRKIDATSAHKVFVHNHVSAAVHRFEESIAGRTYLIEVAAVSKDRWRAYIVRVPGVPTALMPFYGQTPDEAAGQLCAWLTRAYERASASVASPS
jgi:hypothetical protein